MEQHNIDSRFKEGLGNISRQPSADAWARLQNQMAAPSETPMIEPEKEERKKPFLWLSIAATVVMLLVSVAVIRFTNNSSIDVPQVAVTKPAELPVKTENDNKIHAPVSEIVKAPENAIAVTETPEKITEIAPENSSKNEVKTNLVPSSEKQLAQVTKNTKSEKAILSETVKQQPEKLEIDQQEDKLLAANNSIVTPKTETKTSGLGGMAIEVIVKKDNSENALAMQSAPDQIEKDSKLKTIFKQARNLKNGEKVDLQALGVNSDSKLAMGTRTLHEKFSKVLDI